jgi:hypothetical protein
VSKPIAMNISAHERDCWRRSIATTRSSRPGRCMPQSKRVAGRSTMSHRSSAPPMSTVFFRPVLRATTLPRRSPSRCGGRPVTHHHHRHPQDEPSAFGSKRWAMVPFRPTGPRRK